MRRSLTAVVDDYPHTVDLLAGVIDNPVVEFQFRHYSPVYAAFAEMVQRRAFDVCEMALATYVQARGAGRPITLLPVTMLARFQHEFAMKSARGPIVDPRDLEGRRVGLRSYSQTTGVWLRGILAHQFGVNLSAIEWVVQEQTHVDGFEPPPNLVFAEPGARMGDLLDRGEVSAAFVSYTLDGASDPAPLFEDLATVTQEWYRQTGVIQINHMVCIGTDLVEDQPEIVQAVLSMFSAARQSAVYPRSEGGPLAWAHDLDMVPFGTAAVRPSVAKMLALCIEQGVVGDHLTIDDLLHPTVTELEASGSAAPQRLV